MDRTKAKRAMGTLAALALVASCQDAGQRPGRAVMFQLDRTLAEELTAIRLEIHREPPAELCESTAMLAPEPWNPGPSSLFDTRNLSWGTPVDLTLEPGWWGFVVRGGSEHYAIGEKDRARGCAFAELSGGANPSVTIEMQRIDYPGECGNGVLDDDEMCDDGNRLGDDDCSEDCLATPVLWLNDTHEASQQDPSLSAIEDGYLLTFTSEASGTKQAIGMRLDEHGQSLGIGASVELRLNQMSSDHVQEKPAVAGWPGHMTAIWLDYDPSASTDGGVMVRDIDLGTSSGAAEDWLSTEGGRTQIEPAITGNGTSSLMIAAWTGHSILPQQVMCRRVLEGVPEPGGEYPCSAAPTDSQGQPAVTMAADGSYAVAWSGEDGDSRGILVRFFRMDGTAETGDIAVNTTTNGEQRYPSASFDATGRLLVAWQDASSGQNRVRARLFSSPGEAEGDDFVVGDSVTDSDATTSVPAVAGDPGHGVFLVVWYEPVRGIVGRLVTGRGTFGVNRLVGGEPGTPFADTGSFPVSLDDYPGMRDPTVAISSSGAALVAWVDRGSFPGDLDEICGRVVPTL